MLRLGALACAVFFSACFLSRTAAARSRAAAARRLRRHGGAIPAAKSRPVTRHVMSIGDRLDRTRYASRLRSLLERTGSEGQWIRFKTALIAALLVLPALSVALTGDPLWALVTFAVVLYAPLPLLKAWTARQDRLFTERVEALASDIALYLSCGIPVAAAVELCSGSGDRRIETALEEFGRSTTLGGSSAGALGRLARELDSPDIDLTAKAVEASVETGSDVSRIMASVGEALRERSAIRRELKAQTVQGRLSGRIVAGLPFMFLGLSLLMTKETFSVLFGTVPGLVILGVGAALDILGFLWIRRILDLEV